MYSFHKDTISKLSFIPKMHYNVDNPLCQTNNNGADCVFPYRTISRSKQVSFLIWNNTPEFYIVLSIKPDQHFEDKIMSLFVVIHFDATFAMRILSLEKGSNFRLRFMSYFTSLDRFLSHKQKNDAILLKFNCFCFVIPVGLQKA